MTFAHIRNDGVRAILVAEANQQQSIAETTTLYRSDRQRTAREWVQELKASPLTRDELRAIHITLGPIARRSQPAFGMGPRDIRAAYRWVGRARRSWK